MGLPRLNQWEGSNEPESCPGPESKIEGPLVFATLTLLYILMVSLQMRRPMWFDELLTFDIANAKSIQHMWWMIGKIDFQPPPVYLLSRLSMKAFGDTQLGLRLPSLIEFYCGSMVLFLYVRRKVGSAYAACAPLLLWVGQTNAYATEARPYALLMMFFALLLYSWNLATTLKNRTLALWGVGLSNLGMLSTHVFAPLSLIPFLIAEAERFSRTHRWDFRLWIALTLPLAVMGSYIPLFSGYGSISFPPAFQASFGKVLHFYYGTMSGIGVGLFLALCAALMVPRKNFGAPETRAMNRETAVLFASVFLIPIVLNCILMRRHGAFWDRYAITTEATVYVAMAILLGRRLDRNRRAGYAAALILLILCLRVEVWRAWLVPAKQDASILASVRPDLPLVVAGGVTFFEMNHRENASLLSRVYFVKDRPIALKYTNTNLFEDRGFPDRMDPSLPISAHVANYSSFLRQNHEFLVLGSFDAPEEWLLQKLKDDGARITWLGTFPIPYVDSNLYLARINLH